MLPGALIIVYMAQTLFFLESCYLFVTQYCFFHPIFSQCLECVLPMSAFIALTFVSMGKHRKEESPAHKVFYLPEPLCGRFI